MGISGINRGRIWVYKRLREESGSILGETEDRESEGRVGVTPELG